MTAFALFLFADHNTVSESEDSIIPGVNQLTKQTANRAELTTAQQKTAKTGSLPDQSEPENQLPTQSIRNPDRDEFRHTRVVLDRFAASKKTSEEVLERARSLLQDEKKGVSAIDKKTDDSDLTLLQERLQYMQQRQAELNR